MLRPEYRRYQEQHLREQINAAGFGLAELSGSATRHQNGGFGVDALINKSW